MVINDLTDVTLVSDDTERGLDWCDSGGSQDALEVTLVTDWLTYWLTDLFMVSNDFTDVTLVGDDT